MNRIVLLVLGLLVAVAIGGCSAKPKPEQAEPNLEQATEAYQKGMSSLGKQDFDAAVAAFTEAIRLNPDYAEAYCNRGFAYQNKGHLDKAIADFTEAIRLDPKDGNAYFCRGFAHRKKGEPAKALADFAKAKELGYRPK